MWLRLFVCVFSLKILQTNTQMQIVLANNQIVSMVVTGLFLNGCYEHIIIFIYSINNYILCWPVIYSVYIVAIPMYLGIWALVGAKIERNDACSFQETELI